jgi:hypothetical protein
MKWSRDFELCHLENPASMNTRYWRHSSLVSYWSFWRCKLVIWTSWNDMFTTSFQGARSRHHNVSSRRYNVTSDVSSTSLQCHLANWEVGKIKNPGIMSCIPLYLWLKFGDDPAISLGVISVFGFGPLVAKPRIRLDRNLFCELLLPTKFWVNSS